SRVESPASATPAIEPALSNPAFVKNAGLLDWVADIARLTQPAHIHWCDGSQREYTTLCSRWVAAGPSGNLDRVKRPASYVALSDPSDVARVEDRTFICSE